jgi:hypothetical protein
MLAKHFGRPSAPARPVRLSAGTPTIGDLREAVEVVDPSTPLAFVLDGDADVIRIEVTGAEVTVYLPRVQLATASGDRL